MDSHKQECFDIINDFKDGHSSIDWSTVYTHQDYLDAINDALTNLLYHVSLADTIDEKTKVELVGNLVITQAQQGFAQTFKLEKEFEKQGVLLEKHLKQLINSGTWLKQADASFTLIDSLQDTIENDELTKEQSQALNPVLILLELASLIRVEEHSEDDDCC